jgi:hypothetical protein
VASLIDADPDDALAVGRINAPEVEDIAASLTFSAAPRVTIGMI